MGLRVGTNVASLTVQRNIENNSRETSRSLARLSSGQRIVNAGDDAGGLAIATKLDADIHGLTQASRNANEGVAFAQTAEGGLNEVSNILVRLRELGVQAASDTVGDEERGFMDREYQSLKQEVERIAQVTTFNGKALLNGSGGELSFQVGTHKDENNQIMFKADEADATAGSLGISGAGVGSKGDALDSLDNVDQAIAKVNGYRSSLGAVQNRLHSAANNLSVQMENMSDAKSRIADTDIAEEASKLARGNLLQSAGIAVLAQANASPQGALRLL